MFETVCRVVLCWINFSAGISASPLWPSERSVYLQSIDLISKCSRISAAFNIKSYFNTEAHEETRHILLISPNSLQFFCFGEWMKLANHKLILNQQKQTMHQRQELLCLPQTMKPASTNPPTVLTTITYTHIVKHADFVQHLEESLTNTDLFRQQPPPWFLQVVAGTELVVVLLLVAKQQGCHAAPAELTHTWHWWPQRLCQLIAEVQHRPSPPAAQWPSQVQYEAERNLLSQLFLSSDAIWFSL